MICGSDNCYDLGATRYDRIADWYSGTK